MSTDPTTDLRSVIRAVYRLACYADDTGEGGDYNDEILKACEPVLSPSERDAIHEEVEKDLADEWAEEEDEELDEDE